MRRVALVLAILMFGLGFAFGRGWLPPDSGSERNPVVKVPILDQPSESVEPSYSSLELRPSEPGPESGSIVLRNNARVPMTVMATITLYNGDQTVSTLFARASRVKPNTEQKVGLIGQVEPHTEVAVDLAALP